MKKKQIIGLVVAAALFVGVSAASVFTNTISKNLLQNSADDIINLGGSYQFNPPSEDYIAIVRVEGTIQEQSGSSALEASSGYQHDSTMNYIDELMDDSNNKGILLYVDSPGGTVYESEELYQKLKEYKETTKRPIWDYMAHYAASGGYMVSMASDKIYANSNTTTGSGHLPSFRSEKYGFPFLNTPLTLPASSYSYMICLSVYGIFMTIYGYVFFLCVFSFFCGPRSVVRTTTVCSVS